MLKVMLHLFTRFTSAAVLLGGCVAAPAVEEVDYRDCLSCHEGIEEISPNHPFRCGSCHLLPEDRHEKLSDHGKIVRNPSDPASVELFCGSCHQQEIDETEQSLHATMAGVINQTRYLWGAQPSASPAVYGLSGRLRPLPAPDAETYPDEPSELADDFLRRRCLRCHINVTGPAGEGLYRAAGCAACHVVYEDDGLYRGTDQAIDRSRKGYPSEHRITKLIPNRQCMHCHNGNHVGADYEGFFERDLNKMFRAPLKDGEAPPKVYGTGGHRLSRDVHAERGLLCIDCHDRNVMGDGRTYSFQQEAPKRTCVDCHGDRVNPEPSLSYGDIQASSGGGTFTSKGEGRIHPLPLFSEDSVSHRIQAHDSLRCSACHAQWSYQDYGLSVIREDLVEGYKWHRLSSQGDPDLEKTMGETLSPAGWHYPLTKDRLTGEAKAGIWSLGWRFRRWEDMPLGVDREGRVSILRPLYQYLVSYVDKLGGIPLDSEVPERGDERGRGWAFMPYVPHTTAPAGRVCESCHLNRIAAGLGADEDPLSDAALTRPSPPAIEGMRLLSPREQEALLNPSQTWRKERLKDLI